MTIYHGACPFVLWIINATNTRLECVMFTTFLLQQWLHERASLLHCTYIAYLVILAHSLGLKLI
jgi:hypothetical protein